MGARGSLLSRMQSQLVADALEKRHPGLRVELVIYKTTGDQIQDRPLHEAGGKGLFTKELEQGLLDGAIDFAVHSFKDVPITEPLVAQENLQVAAVPPREDPRDVLVSGKARSIDDLPQGAKVGTGSLRRRVQLLARRADLDVQLIRGNIDTRLRKLRNGDFDAILLAMAGLRRSGLFDEHDMSLIDADDLLPAAGQGALALQCRRDDPATAAVLAAMHDKTTARCVALERDVVAALNGDCHSPIAAYATIEGDTLRLRVAVGARDGNPPLLRSGGEAPVAEAADVVLGVVNHLKEQGVERLLLG